MEPTHYHGVDFSGAKLAGRNTWVATCDPAANGRRAPLRLVGLASLESLVGSAERDAALTGLARLIRASRNAVWAMDFPFSVPLCLNPSSGGWTGQLREVTRWDSGAYAYGLECVRRAKSIGEAIHIRRQTDRLAKTPFDCYHYRIIYQTFHGMRDVLAPLAADRTTAVLPFQYSRLSAAKRVVMECCPGSLLKALNLPHQNYKQPAGGPLTARRRATRAALRKGLAELVEVPPSLQRVIDRNPGGDALDAVLAAACGFRGWMHTDHSALSKRKNLCREGWVYL